MAKWESAPLSDDVERKKEGEGEGDRGGLLVATDGHWLLCSLALDPCSALCAARHACSQVMSACVIWLCLCPSSEGGERPWQDREKSTLKSGSVTWNHPAPASSCICSSCCTLSLSVTFHLEAYSALVARTRLICGLGTGVTWALVAEFSHQQDGSIVPPPRPQPKRATPPIQRPAPAPAPARQQTQTCACLATS